MIFFVGVCHFGNSLLAGALTVAIMVLPTVMRTTEEALISVPNSYREGSFGLGAGKLRTVFKVVLPSAVPGILSGIILATGRIVGIRQERLPKCRKAFLIPQEHLLSICITCLKKV